MKLEISRLTANGMEVVGSITILTDGQMRADDRIGRLVLAHNPGATAAELINKYNGDYLKVAQAAREEQLT